MHTRADELAILDEAIQTLGTDSYLGPWLAQVRGEVASAIRSDFFPEITIKDSVRVADRIVHEANIQRDAILAKAKENAARIEASAVRYQAEICENIRQALRDL